MSFRKYEIPSDFKVLPMDIIYKIFSNFTPKELCTLTAVSKWFCYFSSLEELWRGHCTKDLNCKLQRITSPSWKQHYLDIYKLERSLERDLLEKITFSTILKIKSKFDKDWENILLSLIEHSPLSFNIFGRCIDTTTKEIFASFLHWIISHGTEISIRWIMEYCFTLEDGIQRALSPTSSSELNSNDYTPPLLLAAYLGKENIVKFILEWLDTMKLTEVYSNEGISHHEIQSIVQSNPIIVPRKEMSIGRSNSYKLSPVFPFALSPPGKNSVFSPSSPNLSPLSNIIPNNNNKPFYPPIMSVSVPNHISKTSPHQSAPQINQLIVNNENLQNNSPINFSPINFIVGNNNFIAQNLNQHFARPNCPQSIPNSKILIQQRGAGGTSAIQLAAGQGHFGIVKYLLEKGSSPNITDKNGNSPLHAAAIHGHLDCLQLLIDVCFYFIIIIIIIIMIIYFIKLFYFIILLLFGFFIG